MSGYEKFPYAVYHTKGSDEYNVLIVPTGELVPVSREIATGIEALRKQFYRSQRRNWMQVMDATYVRDLPNSFFIWASTPINPEDSIVLAEFREYCLSLPQRDLSILILHYQDGLTYTEMEDLVGLKRSQISAIARSRRKEIRQRFSHSFRER